MLELVEDGGCGYKDASRWKVTVRCRHWISYLMKRWDWGLRRTPRFGGGTRRKNFQFILHMLSWLTKESDLAWLDTYGKLNARRKLEPSYGWSRKIQSSHSRSCKREDGQVLIFACFATPWGNPRTISFLDGFRLLFRNPYWPFGYQQCVGKG